MRISTCLCYTLCCVGINIFVIAFLLQWNPLNWQLMSHTRSKPSVIVVGGGLAGLSATIEAVRHGAQVTIIEKESKVGGNSAKATSGINAVGTEAQDSLSIEDNEQSFIKDTIASGDGLADPGLVEILVRNSNSAIQFLTSFGLSLTDVVQLGGHSAKRTHRFPPTKEGKPVPVGFTIMSTLRKHVENNLKESVTILTQSKFKDVIINDEKVVGVVCTNSNNEEIQVKGTVVLTAGGFANDHTEKSLLDRFTPHLSAYPTTNGPWATGDIIKSVEPHGFSLIHMDKVQVHPTGFVDPKAPTFHTKFLAPEALRGCGGILLNATGQRFVNELGRRDHVSQKILTECGPFDQTEGSPTVAVMLLSQKVIDKFGAHLAGFYIFKGLIQKAGNLADVANKLGVNEEVIVKTIEEYNSAATNGQDSFGKNAFPMQFDDNDVYFIAYITPTLHYCMGGLKISTKAEIMVKESSMLGVYAAGEVSGGVHGQNRLGGNSLLECVVFGRIAGKEAAHSAS